MYMSANTTDNKKRNTRDLVYIFSVLFLFEFEKSQSSLNLK